VTLETLDRRDLSGGWVCLGNKGSSETEEQRDTEVWKESLVFAVFLEFLACLERRDLMAHLDSMVAMGLMAFLVPLDCPDCQDLRVWMAILGYLVVKVSLERVGSTQSGSKVLLETMESLAPLGDLDNLGCLADLEKPELVDRRDLVVNLDQEDQKERWVKELLG
jgi:hypothetical protein